MSRRASKTANKLRRKSAPDIETKKSNGGSSNSNSNSSSSLLEYSYDKCHNNGVPCCNALRDIVTNIFPDIDININIDIDINVNILAEKQKVNKEQVPPELNSNAKIEIAPSLFSLVVRKYLLEDRVKRRLDGAHGNGNGNGNGNANAQSQSLSLSGTNGQKKKRKKKKKKQKSGSESADKEEAAIPVPTCRTTPRAAEGIDSHIQTDADKSSPVQSPSVTVTTVTCGAQQTTTSPQSTSTRTATRTPSNAKVDMMLDKLLSPNTETEPTSITLPNNRDLISLFEYIQTRHRGNESKQCKKGSSTSPGSNGNGNGTSTSNGTSNGTSNKRSSMMPSIPLQEINAVIQKITCRDCQTACSEYLKRMSCNPAPSTRSTALEVGWGGFREDHNQGILDASKDNGHGDGDGNGDGHGTRIINSIQFDESCVAVQIEPTHFSELGNSVSMKGDEHAFDYDLMEEGGEPCCEGQILNGHGERNGHLTGSHGIRMDLVQDKNTTHKHFQLGQGDDLAFTVDNFDCLMKNVIIPCGMKEVAAMTEEDVKKVATCTKRLSEYLFNLVKCTLPEALSDAQKALADAGESLKTPGPFNVKAVNSLRHCCQRQVHYMDVCKQFLTKLDSRTVHMRASKHEHQKWAIDLMDRLWDSYMVCSGSLVEPSLRCMWEGIQLDCNRTGSVPQHFNSPQQRENLKKMLEKRLFLLTKLQDKIEVEVLSCPRDVNSTVPVLRRLAAFGEYFALNEDSTADSEDLLAARDEMMVLRDEMICSTIYQTDVKTILKMQSDRCSQSYEKTANVFNLLNERLENIEMSQKDRLTWQAATIMIEENVMAYEESRDKDMEPSLDRDMNEVLNLCDFVKNILNQFRFYENVKAAKSMEKVGENVKIPSQVLRICEGAVTSFKCEGGCGLRRVAGILSACLYSWLQEQCMEWHADLTHQELMIETEEEVLQESKEAAANQQKKKSKKKKRRDVSKKNVSPEADVEPNSKSQAKYEEKSSDSTTSLESDEEKEWNEPMKEPAESDRDSARSERTIEGGPSETPAPNTAAREEPSPESTPEEAGDEALEEDDKFFEKENIKVSVVDRETLISAESFLCARYFQVLEDSNMRHYQ